MIIYWRVNLHQSLMKTQLTTLKALLLIALGVTASGINAQDTYVSYVANSPPSGYNSTIWGTSAPGMTASDVTAGVGLAYDPVGSYLGFSGFNSTTLSDAITNGDYMTYTVSLDNTGSTSYLLTAQRSFFIVGTIQTGWSDTAESLHYTLRSSADGFSTDLLTDYLDVQNPGTHQTGYDRVGTWSTDLTAFNINLNPGSSLEFRYYMYGATQIDGITAAPHGAPDDMGIVFNPAAVPEVSSTSLVCLTLGGLMLRRRRSNTVVVS